MLLRFLGFFRVRSKLFSRFCNIFPGFCPKTPCFSRYGPIFPGFPGAVGTLFSVDPARQQCLGFKQSPILWKVRTWMFCFRMQGYSNASFGFSVSSYKPTRTANNDNEHKVWCELRTDTLTLSANGKTGKRIEKRKRGNFVWLRTHNWSKNTADLFVCFGLLWHHTFRQCVQNASFFQVLSELFPLGVSCLQWNGKCLGQWTNVIRLWMTSGQFV